MSKESDKYGYQAAFRIAALAFLGFITTFYPANTGPGEWAADKKKKLKRK